MSTEPRQSRLIQLGNGDWIDLLDVRQVRAFDRDDTNPDRVSIVLADGTHIIVGCESPDDAAAERDRVAGLVNAARAEEPEAPP